MSPRKSLMQSDLIDTDLMAYGPVPEYLGNLRLMFRDSAKLIPFTPLERAVVRWQVGGSISLGSVCFPCWTGRWGSCKRVRRFADMAFALDLCSRSCAADDWDVSIWLGKGGLQTSPDCVDAMEPEQRASSGWTLRLQQKPHLSRLCPDVPWSSAHP